MVQENMKAFGTMAEKETPKTKETQPEIKGALTYEDKVVQKIVGLALESVDGLLSVEGGFFSNLTGKLINTDDVTTGVDGQTTNICWIIEKAREFQKNIYFHFIDYAKAFDCVDHNKL